MKKTEIDPAEIHENNIDVFNREIFLFQEIDSNVAREFIKNFYILDRDKKPITIHLQSEGGDWYSTMSIFDAISHGLSHVKIICYGYVASGGTIILQAADERITMPRCIFMIHEGSQEITGTYKQAQSNIAIDKESRDVMLDIFTNRCKMAPFFSGKAPSKVKTYIRTILNTKEDWYLSAGDALKYGIVDGIYQ